MISWALVLAADMFSAVILTEKNLRRKEMVAVLYLVSNMWFGYVMMVGGFPLCRIVYY